MVFCHWNLDGERKVDFGSAVFLPCNFCCLMNEWGMWCLRLTRCTSLLKECRKWNQWGCRNKAYIEEWWMLSSKFEDNLHRSSKNANQNLKTIITKTVILFHFSSSFCWGRKVFSILCKERSSLHLLNYSISCEWGTKIKLFFFKYASWKKPSRSKQQCTDSGLVAFLWSLC